MTNKGKSEDKIVYVWQHRVDPKQTIICLKYGIHNNTLDVTFGTFKPIRPTGSCRHFQNVPGVVSYNTKLISAISLERKGLDILYCFQMKGHNV